MSSASTGAAERKWSDFLALWSDLENCQGIASILFWDQDLNLPAGAAEQRGEQLGWIESFAHRIVASDRFFELAGSLAEDSSLAPEKRDAARFHLRRSSLARRVPERLVTALAAKRAEAIPAWKDAKTSSDWSRFAPSLEGLLALSRERADCLKEARETAYDAMVGEYDPGVSAQDVARVLSAFSRDLTPLVQGWLEKAGSRKPRPRDWSMPLSEQDKVSRLALKWLGFDFECGRLDVSVHPFCGGHGTDVRVTTRYAESDWTDSLYSVLREGGHALYEQGLAKLVALGPLRQAAGMAMHESQSRFWENCVGRSRAFCEVAVEDLAAAGLDLKGATADDLFAYLNQVEASFIRVAADEATYNLHVLLRYEIESALVSKDFKVADVPGAWNEKTRSFLRIEPPDDARGCLQDVHWAHGSFGYFPSYSVGNLIAAQLLQAARREFDVDACVRARGFARLREWLGTRVHSHGCRWNTLELAERATGAPLSHAPFIEYLRAKLD